MHMMAVCACVFWQQGWCLGWHVRRRRLLLWHLHGHLVSRQDVLKKREKHLKSSEGSLYREGEKRQHETKNPTKHVSEKRN